MSSSDSETSSAVHIFKHRVRASVDKIRDDTRRLRELQIQQLLGNVSDATSGSYDVLHNSPTKHPDQGTLLEGCLTDNKLVPQVVPPPDSPITRGPAARLFVGPASENTFATIGDDPFVVHAEPETKKAILQDSRAMNHAHALPTSRAIEGTQSSIKSEVQTKSHITLNDQSTSRSHHPKPPPVIVRNVKGFRPPSPIPALTRSRAQPEMERVKYPFTGSNQRPRKERTAPPEPEPVSASQSGQRLPSSESSILLLGLSALSNMKVTRPGETIGSILASSSSGSLTEAMMKLGAQGRSPSKYSGSTCDGGRATVAAFNGTATMSSSTQMTSVTSVGCSAWIRRSGRHSAHVPHGDIEAGGGVFELGCNFGSEYRHSCGGDGSMIATDTERSRLSRAMASLVHTVTTAFLSPWKLMLGVFGCVR